MSLPDRDALQAAMIRLADGDRSAARPVFSAVEPRVRRFVTRMVPASDVDDVVQEVMVRMFREAPRYQADKPVMPWAMSIAYWACRTATSRRRRNPTVLTADLDTRPGDRPDPEGLALSQEVADALADAMDGLPVADRETLEAYLSDEAPQNAAFRKRKQRALARLRSIWRTGYGAS